MRLRSNVNYVRRGPPDAHEHLKTRVGLPDAVKGCSLIQAGPVEPTTVTSLQSNPLVVVCTVLPQLSTVHAMDKLQG